MDGVEATRRLCELDIEPRPGVLVVTTFGDDRSLYEALRAGASGFILKDASPEELIDAVRVVARGECVLAPSVTRALVEQFAWRPRPVTLSSALGELTARELDVLGLIAGGLSNTEIADELTVRQTTVKSHVGRIFTKLGLRDRAQAVVLAYESRLVQPDTAKHRYASL
jgi:DNA-binding NarL/FixJ family response regulator